MTTQLTCQVYTTPYKLNKCNFSPCQVCSLFSTLAQFCSWFAAEHSQEACSFFSLLQEFCIFYSVNSALRTPSNPFHYQKFIKHSLVSLCRSMQKFTQIVEWNPQSVSFNQKWYTTEESHYMQSKMYSFETETFWNGRHDCFLGFFTGSLGLDAQVKTFRVWKLTLPLS